jgi:rhodanese-related sulfurtransferase/molybdopterin converting factor small subunit
MAKVMIPTPLRQFTGKQDAATVAGNAVGEVQNALTTQYPDLRQQILNDEGKVRSFVNVYLNDEDIRYLSKDVTAAKDSDTISLVPSIAGGAAVATPPEAATLSKDEILRYSRHLIIPEVGAEGQQRLKAALVDYHQFCAVPRPSQTPAQGTKVNEGEIDVLEVKAMLDRGEKFVLIDVREPHEYKICNIPAAKLIPLGEVPKRLGELDPGADIVIHCRSGVRSAKACGILRQAGFQHVLNMKGGILAWSDKVDPSVPKY